MKHLKSIMIVQGVSLALTLLYSPAVATEYSDAVLADSPALYWSFDGLNGNNNISEMVSGLASDQLVPANAPLIDHADPEFASGLDLGMAGDMATFNKATYFAANLSPSSPLANAYAIEFWARFLNNDFSYIMNFGQGSPYPGDQPGVLRSWASASGPGAIDLEGIGAGKTLGSPAVMDDDWHHYSLIVYGASDSSWGVAPRTEIMIDNGEPVEITNTYTGALNWQGPVAVGAAFGPGVGPSAETYNLVGYLDEVAIYDLGNKSVTEIEAFCGELTAHFVDFAPKLPGDANFDGVVDAADAAVLATNWQTTSGANWSMGDFNEDGAVNDIDATILASNWQSSEAGAQSVPEPSIIAVLLCLCLTALLSLPRHRQ